ncbi:MAG: TonB-dependent receptor, partial [Bryobacterales bacterium]|nr:TonB-dependent receptor [Bryobacterales bacterium]
AGVYDLSVEASSIAVRVRNVEAHAGGYVEVNITMGLDKSNEKIDVETSSASVTDALSTQIFPLQVIQDLPIDGRRFQDFATLAPAVQADAATLNQLSFLGQRPVYANIMIDGADYNEAFLGGIRGSDRSSFAFTIPQSAVQEFETVTSGYSAEYGRSTGGVLNAITRSGNNATHGEAFYLIRDSDLSLGNPFGFAALESQQQFGGSAGGAIIKNRLFWFAAAEGQLASIPRRVQFAALDSVANSLTPAITPAYDYFRSIEGPFSQTNNAYTALGKLDYQISDSNRLAVHFTASHNHAANAASDGTSWIPETSSALSNNGAEEDSVRTAVLQWTSILPHGLLNDLRLEYSGELRATQANSASPDVEAGIIGSFGTQFDLPIDTNDYRLQFGDTLTIQHGFHAFVLGGDYNFLHANQRDGMNQYGTFVISSSDVSSILTILSNSGANGNRFDDPSVVYLRQVGNSQVKASGQQLSLFAQDEWRVYSRLTVSYGLRWDGQLNPQPNTSNSFLVNNVLNYPFPLGRVDPTQIRSQLNQWAPRASIAWNVTESGKTVVRAGAGLFYGQTPLAFYANALNNFSATGGDLSLQIAPIGGATVYQQFARAGFNLNQTPLNQLPVLSVADVWAQIAGEPNQFAQANVFTTSGANFRNPRSFQTTGSIEHQMKRTLTISYQFSSLNTVHLPQVIDFNVPTPFVQPGDLSLRPFFGLRSGTPRPNPNLGAVDVLESSARSTYFGNSLSARYRLKRAEFMGQYTLSYNKSDNDLEWPFVSTTYQNPYNLKEEWGWSSLDSRQQASGYGIYHAPKGIEITGIFRARTGLPIDATAGGDPSQLLTTTNIGNRP